MMLEQLRRQRQLQLQQLTGGLFGQMGGGFGGAQVYPQMGIQPMQAPIGFPGQVSAGLAENPYQNVTTPFPVQNPWQMSVPRTFNQGSAYNPFIRRW
jgi:hypothetical protein